MDEVAELAGVGVGTLYRHFPTKEDLVLELVRQGVQGYLESAREALTRDDPWEAIEWLVRQKAASMARSRGLRDMRPVVKVDPAIAERARVPIERMVAITP